MAMTADERRARTNTRRAADRERVNEQARRYYQANREKRIAQVQAYHAADPNRRHTYATEYNRNRLPERLAEVAAELNIPGVVVVRCPMCGNIWRYTGARPYAICGACRVLISLRRPGMILRDFPY